MKSTSACYLLYAGLLLGLFFDPEEGGYMFVRNIGSLSMDYTALYFRRWNFSEWILTEIEYQEDKEINRCNKVSTVNPR
jgi:acyl-CoA thioesterase